MPLEEAKGFSFSAEQVLARITPRTRLLILNSPANPTGGVTPKAEIDRLVAGLERFPDVAIMSDEIYDVMTYDDSPSQAEGFLEPKREFGVVISDLGQAFGIQRSRLVFACHIDASLDMVIVVVPSDDGGFADLPGPPADVSQAIFDGPR